MEKKQQDRLRQLLALTNLKDLGVKNVDISFSGSGDSGDIDEVEFRSFDGAYCTSTVIEQFALKSIKVDELFADLAWDIISDKVDPVGDWVNNEGGYGSIRIDVEEQRFDLDYHQRTTDDYDWSDEMLFI